MIDRMKDCKLNIGNQIKYAILASEHWEKLFIIKKYVHEIH